MATISKVRICNMALSKVGAKSTIESLSEASAEANECELWYDWSRLQTLEASDWSFARRRLTLATHSDAPPTDLWGYRYQYPSDCVSFRRLVNPLGRQADPVPFEIELDLTQDNRSILTDLEDAVGVYTMDLETVALYSPLFVEMLSYALASRLAMPLTGTETIEERMALRFASMQAIAHAANANEQALPPSDDADTILARV